MKFSFILLLVSMLQVHALSYSQTATITINQDAKISDVFKSIESQTEYRVFYKNDQIDVSSPSGVKAGKILVKDALTQMLRKSKCGYTMSGKMIVIVPRDNQQGRKITGTVFDAAGEPMIGVNISIKGTNKGTITNMEGKFELEDIPANSILVVSYIGYLTQELPIGNLSSFNIILREDTQNLEEVVVLGYGAQTRKKDLSAAVGVVENMEALKKRPVMNVTSLLQGQVPGVTISNNGGSPAEGANIVIRGKGSQGGESPLWVVDGIPGGSVMTNEIESITILKDAASAAIYGAQSGSAGVILVTTKKAEAGKPSIIYEGTYGLSTATHLPQSLTIEQERQVREQSYAADGLTLPDGWDVTKNPYISTTRTDWMNAIFRTAFTQRHYAALTGGTENMTHKLSVEYYNDQGTLIDTWNKQFNLRYNGMYKISKYVQIREDLFWNEGESRGTETSDGYTSPIMSALVMPRSAEVYNADGTYGGTAPSDPAYAAKYGSNFADIHGDVVNPVRTLKANNQFNKPTTISSSSFLNITFPIEGLKYTGRFTYALDKGFSKIFSPRRTEPGKPDLNNTLSYAANRFTKWEVENTLNYDRTFDRHQVGVLLSTTSNKQSGKSFNLTGKNLDNEADIYQYINYAQTTVVGDSYDNADANVSLVGRLAYSFDNRYFITASFRRDYAGRLPEGKKYGNFPAFTAAWKLSEEAFFPRINFLNDLKLRGSWGRIGNLGSISYTYGDQALSMWNNTYIPIGENPGFGTTTTLGSAFNQYLTWETSEQTDFGLDATFLNNRLDLSVDWFNKRTYNLIKGQDVNWPSYIGLGTPLINEGEIQNRGWEFSVSWNDKVNKDWSYFVNANLATLTNKITNIGSVNPETGEKPVWMEGTNYRNNLAPYRSVEGGPLYSYWVIQTDGLFQTDAEAAAYVDKEGNRIQPFAKAGDIKFIDRDGNGVIDDDDRVQLTDSYTPKLTYALTGGFTYKNLSFSMMLQGVQGLKAFNVWKSMILNEAQGNFNRWDKILDAFPVTNEVPRLTTRDLNGNFTTCSDYFLEDASYLRIKNITLGYSLTDLLRKNPHFMEKRSMLDIYASIDNLVTFTKYTGIDPEIGGIGFDAGKYPVPRIISFGIKLTY